MTLFPLRLVPADTHIDFIGRRTVAYAVSATIVLLSIGAYLVNGLNYGIDFKGGILIEVRTPGPANLDELRGRLAGLGLGEVALQEFGTETDVLIRIERQAGGEEAQQAAVEKVKEALADTVRNYRRTEFVGPKVGGELIEAGIIAVVLSLLGIMAYVWFRFEWQFSVAAIVALTHDVIATIGLFSILGLEFNLSSVAAVLTIAGYSINDTVVVFDRIRENLRRYKTMDLRELIDLSVNQTLSRTVLTSGTTLVTALALMIFGGPVLSGFATAFVFGILIGTYSSIFVASALLMYTPSVRIGKFAPSAEQRAQPG